MTTVNERLTLLRHEMKKREIDIYIVPTADFHESEYVGDYFKCREYITGFTGSAGTAVVTMEQAGLWTDGRYFIQAKQELEGTEVELYRMGEPDVPEVKEFVERHLPQRGTIGFDGRVMSTKNGETYEKIANEKDGKLYVQEDLIDLLWSDRPELPYSKMFLLEWQYTGKSVRRKLESLREKMEEMHTDTHILTSLYDIAWLLNVRGNDIPCVPVTLSYCIVTKEDCTLYVNLDVLSQDVVHYFQDNQVQIKAYNCIYEDVENISADCKVLLDKGIVNYRLTKSLPNQDSIVDAQNPTLMMKAVKNQVEIDNIRKAHVKDGVAVTKFMFWLKQQMGYTLEDDELREDFKYDLKEDFEDEPEDYESDNEDMEVGNDDTASGGTAGSDTAIKDTDSGKLTECSVAEHLLTIRKDEEHFLESSFETISAYGANAAMMHYQAKEGWDSVLQPRGFLLVDSGGHYMEGTTDITRTFALGPLTEEERKMFTLVCKSNLTLANAKFPYGCRGWNLDILARQPFWQMGLDYRCGTGHGVGYMLNVHESPNAFRWKITEDMSDNCVLEEGMVTTDEPGYYKEGGFGIRTENELLCVKGEQTEYGQFMEFETITYAPIDLDAIDIKLLTEQELKWLNEYHRMVYETISGYLTGEERKWLQKYTREMKVETDEDTSDDDEFRLKYGFLNEYDEEE